MRSRCLELIIRPSVAFVKLHRMGITTSYVFFALSQAGVSLVTFIANCARLYPMVREIDVVRMLDGRSALGSHND